jgi:serine O-acetyltransferase
MRQIYRRIIQVLFGLDVHVMFLYRCSRFFYLRVPFVGPTISVIIRHILRVYAGCEIAPTAVIDPSVKFPHPMGIVIGDGARIDAGTKIWQQVTIGSHGKSGQQLQYPIIGKNVRIYAKASVLGGVRIGDSAAIGAHSLVLCDVPEGKTAAGVPARIL